MARVVIKWRDLPAFSPLTFSIALWLLLDRLGAPGVVWGIVGTIVAVMWIGFLYELWTEKQVSVFHPDAIDEARRIRAAELRDDVSRVVQHRIGAGTFALKYELNLRELAAAVERSWLAYQAENAA